MQETVSSVLNIVQRSVHKHDSKCGGIVNDRFNVTNNSLFVLIRCVSKIDQHLVKSWARVTTLAFVSTHSCQRPVFAPPFIIQLRHFSHNLSEIDEYSSV